MVNSILDEKKHLEETQIIIDNEIKAQINSEEKVKKDATKLSFEDRLRGTHLNLNAELYNIGDRINKLELSKKNPYFGRIDYKKSNENQASQIYIGKHSISHNNKHIVYDWRSPICGLYYDSEIGPVSYEAKTGTQFGELLLKRQIIIKDGKLISAVDSSFGTDDELLIPYLNENTDNKMKTIIASIQKEQNAIIRAKNDNMIIQGVAGSGKTSVALHRIAYLLYTMSDKLNSNNFLIIGPNDYFLNYISSVLPELDTTPIEQKTLLKIMNEYIDTNLTLNIEKLSSNKATQEMQKNISHFKSSSEYKELIEQYIRRCLSGNEIIKEDFKLDGKTVFSKEMIRDRLLDDNATHFDYDRTYRYLKKLFKEEKEKIYDSLNEEYRQMYTTLAKDNPLRKEYIRKSEELEKTVKKQGEKELDKYLKSIKKSCLHLYVEFISKLDTFDTSLSENEIKLLQKETLKNIRKKQISFEDITALIYTNYLFTNKKLNYNNIIIDEAQDYSEFTYQTLNNVFENAKFNIYGDIAQAIYPYRSIASWESLNQNAFENKCSILELSKSYRTTIEITENANNILKALNLNNATPVIRHGKNIKFIDTNCNHESKEEIINKWIKEGYQTIAIICKDEPEASKVQKELMNNGINSRYISNKDDKYIGNVFVLTVESSKGLEFDCTIINDASENIYNIDSNIDMHLLYVANTRALHEQVIMYSRNITKPFKQEINNKVLRKTK